MCGLLAALLFGLSAPASKLLLPTLSPLLLAGLLYLGAGVSLGLAWLVRRAPKKAKEAPLRRADLGLLAGIVILGGVLGPVLMLSGLQRVSGVAGALLLNLEAPLTLALALVVFGEHLERRALLGALLIVGGAAVLGLGPGPLTVSLHGVALLAGACLAWALDNNLTQRLSLRDPIAIGAVKTLSAGMANTALALALGHHRSSPGGALPLLPVALALGLGTLSYGVSIVLDVMALRLLGAAREAAYFATAPFIGALAAIPLLGERPGLTAAAAAALMAGGVVALYGERHSHAHVHEPVGHEHAHVHDGSDEHHDHPHAPGQEPASPTAPHSHWHEHPRLVHEHPHVSDLHHRHGHGHE
jgi:drug/metabolite transporter (DMT)-like permease